MFMKLGVVSRVGESASRFLQPYHIPLLLHCLKRKRARECALSVFGLGPRSETTASPRRCFLLSNMALGISFIARGAIHSFHHWQCWQLKKRISPMSSL